MSGYSYGQYARSFYVQENRPLIPRQRSNSLPPGLALMNAEEAGMIFSAAERAAARRRKMVSVDNTISNSPVDCLDNSSISTPGTIKPSPPRQITSILTSLNKPLPPDPPKAGPDSVQQPRDISHVSKSIPSAITLPESILQSLPVSPLSSPKRLVPSHSLKTYADGLFQFTQNRLTSTIPQLRIDSPQKSPENTPEISSEPRELASVASTQSIRPFLQSRFSDWSTTTGANSESQRNSLSHTPIDLDSDMLSPDSFFSDTNAVPNQPEFNFNRFSGVSFASSETYEPTSTLPPPTPLARSPVTDGKEEISYFTNFDVYLHQETSQGEWPLMGEDYSENIMIDLSPLDIAESSQTVTSHIPRERANTAIRRPVRSAPLPQTNTQPLAACAMPTTPLQIADVAVRVPHWLIGAIG